ncbi:Inactive phospholipase C-like protein 2 [Labeo rohita]|uniref:Inactive phospholipase C-like protein 2 n=1 Tax=Labeo rohita TaxID=84645 RepID=A0ABQ8L2G5_LABRO|nr:Inactive phospholipase C-like protein 2 [Labeo rohita]
MATPSPYTRPAPIRCKCVANRTTKKAVSYHYKGDKIKIESFHLKTVTALSDGTNVYTTSSQGTFSAMYGRQNIYFGRTSTKFRAAPLALSDAAEKAAKDILCPPSHPITGEEEDIFSRGDYLTIHGQVEKVQEARMTKVQEAYVPILDLHLRCGQNVLEVSLWRDEALSDLYIGDDVELTHLKAFLKENGKGKLNSSTYTTIKIVGVSDGTDSLTLLSGNFEEFSVPASLYHGSVEELIESLPVKLEIKHINKRVLDIAFVHS